MTRRKTTVLAALGLALVVGVGAAALAAQSPAVPAAIAVASPTPQSTPSPMPTPSPTIRPTPSPMPTPSPTPPLEVESTLTGIVRPTALATRFPIAVLIDDNRIARPQSGFNGASIVYQAPADGGETRYMFVYQDGDSVDIGPVRSGRIYFAHWAVELHAAVGHYGGDRQTRRYLAAGHGKTLWSVDGLGRGSGAYHRIRTRRAPHNAYTSTADLRAVATRLGAPPAIGDDVKPYLFVDETPLAERPASQTIRIPYRTGIVAYGYDRGSNLYLRTLDGRAQMDPADGRRVTTRNVVVLFQAFSIDTRIEPGHARPVLKSIGTGKALIFQEGEVIKGTWSKANHLAPTRLLDEDGNPISLVRGRTFIQVVATGTKVTFRS